MPLTVFDWDAHRVSHQLAHSFGRSQGSCAFFSITVRRVLNISSCQTPLITSLWTWWGPDPSERTHSRGIGHVNTQGFCQLPSPTGAIDLLGAPVMASREASLCTRVSCPLQSSVPVSQPISPCQTHYSLMEISFYRFPFSLLSMGTIPYSVHHIYL